MKKNFVTDELTDELTDGRTDRHDGRNSYLDVVSQCLKVILNSRKMRPLQFHGLEVCNNCIKLRERKILNLHDGLLSYQPTSTANSAHQG